MKHCYLILFIFVCASFAKEYEKITLLENTETYMSAPIMNANGTMTGGGSYSSTKYSFTCGGGPPIALDYSGENLKKCLNPKSGGQVQMKIYAAKKEMALVGAAGFIVFALLSATVGTENTGTTTTKPDQYGNLQTTQGVSVTGLGYSFIALAGVSAITGLYCYFSQGKTLQKAIEMHNNSLKTTTTINFGYSGLL
jgi:hypothetical protein